MVWQMTLPHTCMHNRHLVRLNAPSLDLSGTFNLMLTSDRRTKHIDCVGSSLTQGISAHDQARAFRATRDWGRPGGLYITVCMCAVTAQLIV